MGDKTKPESFLCRYCKNAMCKDCRLIAEEYQQLFELQKRSLWNMDKSLEKALDELKIAKKRADDYEAIMKVGHHPIIVAWLDSLSSSGLRKKVEQVISDKEA